MRVLVSAVPSLGHVVPLLDLSRALQSAGHEVRFATNAESHRPIADAGLRPVSAGMTMAAMAQERRRRWPESDRQPATVWATRMWAHVMAPSTLADLLDLMVEWVPDVIIHDEGEYAGPVAASRAGIPWITHAWGSPLRPAEELDELEQLTSDLWESCGLTVPAGAGLYAHALVNPCPAMLQAAPRDVSALWPMRPSVSTGRGALLHADAYVGFGTVPTFAEAPAELKAAVTACTERGLTVVVTAPSEELRQSLMALEPELVQAREYVSLAHLLPSCKVVISHAGAGTVLAALSSAVPVVLIPRGAPSQMRMAEACQHAGVGRKAEAASVSQALQEVLAEPSIASATSRVAAQIAEMPEAPDLVQLVESLVTS